MSIAAETDPDARARSNALRLAMAHALVGSAAPIVISQGGFIGTYLAGDGSPLATAPVTGYNVGVALGAVPAAMLMGRIGRRGGFSFGAGLVLAGTALAAWAIFAASFWTVIFATLVIGAGASYTQQYRFAAADQGSDAFKPKAISYVLAGGLACAVIGPQLAIWFGDLLAPVPFVGAFLALGVVVLLGTIVLSTLDFDAPPPRSERRDTGRPLSEIAAQPRFIVAVVCGVCTYALMSYVMTGTPLAMIACGHSQDDSTLGIQWHVIAMFGPSFFTGSLIARFGKERIVALGMALLVACAIVGLAGISLANFWIALVLLGIGWNFGFIGATAMLTDCYRPVERAKAQGLNDVLVFGSVAVASLMSGVTLNTIGWEWLNWIVFPIVTVCLVALGLLKHHERKAAPVASA